MVWGTQNHPAVATRTGDPQPLEKNLELKVFGMSGHPHASHSHAHSHRHDATGHPHHRGAVPGSGHGHGHGHSHRPHGASAGRHHQRLAAALAVTLAFSAVEAAAGWRGGSLALVADAGHMLTDGGSLGLSLLAAWLAARPASARHTYGLGRAELLAALANAAAMLLVVAAIVWQAWQRLHDPRPIDGALVSAVASAGLLVNLGVAWLLVKGHHNLNTRSAFLHVVGDALGSVAAIAAGLVVWTTGWRPIDPLLSVLIAALVLVSSVRLVREALHALLDGVPSSVSAAELRQALSAVAGVQGVHDLHIWALSGERVALSAHVRVDALQDWPLQLAELQHRAAALGIDHATFQPELQPCPKLSHCA